MQHICLSGRRKAAVFLVCTGLSASGWADEAAWSLPRLLAAATTSHPLVLGRQSAIQAAEAEQEGAKWQRFPTPSIEAAKPDNLGATTTFRLDQPLWTGGRISAGIEAAGHRLDAAGSGLRETRRDLMLKVIAAWTEALRQQMRRNYAQEGVTEHAKLVELISRRVQREVSPSVDRDFARSRQLQAINDLSTVNQALNNAFSQLSQLAGEPVRHVLGDLATVRGGPATLEVAADRALAVSPQLRRLEAEELAAKSDIDAKRAVQWPQISARLERYAGETPANIKDDQRAMLVVAMQPGAGLSSMAGVDAAIARREAARLAREAAIRELRQQIETDWNEMAAAGSRLDNALQARAMAAEVFDSYSRQYIAGRKTWVDVLNAIREATQSNLVFADALAQLAAARLRLSIQTDTLAIDHAP